MYYDGFYASVFYPFNSPLYNPGTVEIPGSCFAVGDVDYTNGYLYLDATLLSDSFLFA